MQENNKKIYEDVLRYLEGEAGAEEAKELLHHEEPAPQSWKHLKKVVAVADEEIHYPNKQKLYKTIAAKKTNNGVVRKLFSYGIQAAAVAAVLFLAFILRTPEENNTIKTTASSEVKKTEELSGLNKINSISPKISAGVSAVKTKIQSVENGTHQIVKTGNDIQTKKNIILTQNEENTEASVPVITASYRTNTYGKTALNHTMQFIKNRTNSYADAYRNAPGSDEYISRFREKKNNTSLLLKEKIHTKNISEPALEEEEELSLVSRVKNLLTNHIKVQKKTEGGQEFYAYTFETPKVKVAGKFKPDF